MIHSPARIFFVLLLLTLFSFTLALSFGSLLITPVDLAEVFSSADDSIFSQIIFDLRLPRAFAAFLTGGLLALSGALMQVLLRNPLADPYILGVSGGAATVALLLISLGFSGLWIEAGAFAGAILSLLLVFALSGQRKGFNAEHLLLTGVILAAGWGAAINLLLILADAQTVHSMLFWLMGDLSSSRSGLLTPLVLLLALLLSWSFARDLNLLTQGEQKARTLGSPVKPLRWLILLIASLSTAVAVSLAGSVGFVGLVVPHLLRLIIGSNHRLLLPASVVTGGCLLVLADTGARTLLSPQQLPVGVITAVIGVPVFLYLLGRRK